jgi:hypothetical protein
LDRRLGGPITRLGDMEKRKFFTLPGLELQPLSFRAHRVFPVKLVVNSDMDVSCYTVNDSFINIFYNL